ncbi:MAG: SLBB domain-containing protein, partial [Candidatus Krumholzibacteria bacterium]|nr:SLBB domain-containing protein [Candidatus Krumholzibacteria bacterium]
GGILLGGMTVEEAEATLLSRLRETYPSVQSVTLSVIGEESRRFVYVHGEGVRPGKYEFEGDLNVWEAIREAGGTTAAASLVNLRLIRAESDGRKTSIINLQSAIDSGEFGSLPVLRPGDTIIIPGRSMLYQGSGAVNVIGAVVNPAPYNLSGNKTLVDAILSAGGPTGNSNLGRVKIIRRLPEGGTLTIEVDFDRYLNEGDDSQNPVILPDDTVNVPRHSNFFRTIFTDPRFMIGLITTAGTMAALLVTR